MTSTTTYPVVAMFFFFFKASETPAGESTTSAAQFSVSWRSPEDDGGVPLEAFQAAGGFVSFLGDFWFE